MITRRMTRALVVPALALAAAVAGACGSTAQPGVASAVGAQPGTSSSATATTSAADREEQLRQFAQCMRDNGVDLPDPEPGGGFGLGGGSGIRRDDPKVQAAFTACRSKLPGGGQPPKLDAQQLEQYRAFAQCMRDNGVDLPDPDPDGTLQFGPGRGLGQVDPGDPTFQAALTACRDKLAGVFPGRTGQPGGAT